METCRAEKAKNLANSSKLDEIWNECRGFYRVIEAADWLTAK